MIIKEKNTNQAVRQYLLNPSKKTFNKVHKTVSFLVATIQEFAETQMDEKMIVGHVLGKLSLCKNNTVESITVEILKFMRKLYRFERSFNV